MTFNIKASHISGLTYSLSGSWDNLTFEWGWKAYEYELRNIYVFKEQLSEGQESWCDLDHLFFTNISWPPRDHPKVCNTKAIKTPDLRVKITTTWNNRKSRTLLCLKNLRNSNCYGFLLYNCSDRSSEGLCMSVYVQKIYMYKPHMETLQFNITEKKWEGAFIMTSSFSASIAFPFKLLRMIPRAGSRTLSNTGKIKFCSSMGEKLRRAGAGTESHRGAAGSSDACSYSCCLADGRLWATTAPTPAAAACLLSRTLAQINHIYGSGTLFASLLCLCLQQLFLYICVTYLFSAQNCNPNMWMLLIR